MHSSPGCRAHGRPHKLDQAQHTMCLRGQPCGIGQAAAREDHLWGVAGGVPDPGNAPVAGDAAGVVTGTTLDAADRASGVATGVAQAAFPTGEAAPEAATGVANTCTGPCSGASVGGTGVATIGVGAPGGTSN